jgi:flagellar basal-body rod modification protein FlgD
MSSVSSDLLSAMNGTTGAASASASSSGLTGTSAAATQDRFLKLLTTQLQNQDPTNPMDNAALTSQIAQLSTVTGIEQLNTSMTNLMSSLQTGQTMQAASMIGHSVLAPGNSIALASSTSTAADGSTTNSSKAVFGVQLASAADSVKITIRNASGAAVDSIDLGSQAGGVVPIVWDGSTNAGTPAPDGQYTFDVAATAAGSAVAATQLGFGTVSSVSNSTSGVKLNVSNLGAIGMSDVVQIL